MWLPACSLQLTEISLPRKGIVSQGPRQMSRADTVSRDLQSMTFCHDFDTAFEIDGGPCAAEKAPCC